MELIETPTEEVPNIVASLRDGFATLKTFDLSYRKKQLRQLKLFYDEHEKDIEAALKADLGKCKMEGLFVECQVVITEILTAIRDLDEWAACTPVDKDLACTLQLSSPYTKPDPLGVVAIFGAWNYPVQLVLMPLIGAIAAGNAVLLKPSEVAIATSNLFANHLPQYLDQECFRVVTGGKDVAQAVLEHRFDKIFFTGSSVVGRIVMQAAAKHLTPVVLELGGKSPTIVMDDVNISTAAKRVAWGKFMNTGQTCIATDYVLCHSRVKDKFLEAMEKHLKVFYGENPEKSCDYGRIINAAHFGRLQKVLQSSRARVVVGGQTNPSSRYIAPTVLSDVEETDPVMMEELFGPVLPVLTINNIEEAVDFIRKREKPLALYLFTESAENKKHVSTFTSSGGLVVNDTVLHYGMNTLPFGGVGHSGTGCYHGKHSFDAFSHRKACLETRTALDFVAASRYPPYTEGNFKILCFLLTPRQFYLKQIFRITVFVLILVYLAMFFKVWP